MYRTVPNADIYIDHISLQINGEKYKNLCEIKVKPVEITSLKDLTNKLPDDAKYEISTEIGVDSLNSKDGQKLANQLLNNGKRESIRAVHADNNLLIKKATKENLNDVNSILGNINGVTEDITIRIYDCQDSQIKEISKNFNVTNIRNF